MLIGDGHLDKIGGLEAIRSSGLFGEPEPLSTLGARPLYYVQGTPGLLDPQIRAEDSQYRQTVKTLLSPILRPPPRLPSDG